MIESCTSCLFAIKQKCEMEMKRFWLARQKSQTVWHRDRWDINQSSKWSSERKKDRERWKDGEKERKERLFIDYYSPASCGRVGEAIRLRLARQFDRAKGKGGEQNPRRKRGLAARSQRSERVSDHHLTRSLAVLFQSLSSFSFSSSFSSFMSSSPLTGECSRGYTIQHLLHLHKFLIINIALRTIFQSRARELLLSRGCKVEPAIIKGSSLS